MLPRAYGHMRTFVCDADTTAPVMGYFVELADHPMPPLAPLESRSPLMAPADRVASPSQLSWPLVFVGLVACAAALSFLRRD